MNKLTKNTVLGSVGAVALAVAFGAAAPAMAATSHQGDFSQSGHASSDTNIVSNQWSNLQRQGLNNMKSLTALQAKTTAMLSGQVQNMLSIDAAGTLEANAAAANRAMDALSQAAADAAASASANANANANANGSSNGSSNGGGDGSDGQGSGGDGSDSAAASSDNTTMQQRSQKGNDSTTDAGVTGSANSSGSYSAGDSNGDGGSGGDLSLGLGLGSLLNLN